MFDLIILNIEYNCLKALKNSHSFDESALKVLNVIGRSLNCDFCIFWKFDKDSSLPCLHTQWFTHPEYILENIFKDVAVDVCDSKKPVWSNNDILFAIKSPVGVYGVLHIRSKKFSNFNRDFLLSLESLGLSLGKKINGMIQTYIPI